MGRSRRVPSLYIETRSPSIRVCRIGINAERSRGTVTGWSMRYSNKSPTSLPVAAASTPESRLVIASLSVAFLHEQPLRQHFGELFGQSLAGGGLLAVDDQSEFVTAEPGHDTAARRGLVDGVAAVLLLRGSE